MKTSTSTASVDSKSSPVTVDFRYGIDVTIDTDSFIERFLEEDKDLQKRFNAFVKKQLKKNGEEYPNWLYMMEEFANQKTKYGEKLYGGIYGEGEPVTINSYNEPQMLSRVIQFVYFVDPYKDAFVLLQMHQGGDVRGNYSAPKAYRVSGCFDETGIFDYGRATIYPQIPQDYPEQLKLFNDGMDPREVNWTTDDAYHWYFQSSCGMGAGKQLETYPIKKWEDLEEEETQEDFIGKGVIFIGADGTAYCPLTGFPLVADF